MVGGLDSGKVLRVVGMAATMRLSDRGPDDAVNRRISLLVLNKQAEQAILHEPNTVAHFMDIPNMQNAGSLVVLGSINADHILNLQSFPTPGETVTGNHYQVQRWYLVAPSQNRRVALPLCDSRD